MSKLVDKVKCKGYSVVISELCKKYIANCKSNEELELVGGAFKYLANYLSGDFVKNGISFEDYLLNIFEYKYK